MSPFLLYCFARDEPAGPRRIVSCHQKINSPVNSYYGLNGLPINRFGVPLHGNTQIEFPVLVYQVSPSELPDVGIKIRFQSFGDIGTVNSASQCSN